MTTAPYPAQHPRVQRVTPQTKWRFVFTQFVENSTGIENNQPLYA